MAKAQSPLKALFDTVKQPPGIVRMLDEHLITKESEDTTDRKNETNSPSGALGCSRANVYQRRGVKKDPFPARTIRIFENGHGVHDRLQGYLEQMGVLLMREVPLFNLTEEIQGHTDGILDLTGDRRELTILEIKSINTNQFGALKEAKEEHRAQGNVYLFCVEEHRQDLYRTYPTEEEFKRSEFQRRVYYSKRYQHLKDGSKYKRHEKIAHKVRQHIALDNLLYFIDLPITKVLFMYEDKNTQEIKDFTVEWNDDLLDEVLEKYRVNNAFWASGTLPPKECRTKADGKWCPFLSTCFAKGTVEDKPAAKKVSALSPFTKKRGKR